MESIWGESEAALSGVKYADLTDTTYTDNTAVKIEICASHETGTAVYVDEDKHSATCKWCGAAVDENHSFDDNGTCICGAVKAKYLDANGTEQNAICKSAITADIIGSYTTINSGWNSSHLPMSPNIRANT